jgi:hypothetical protein
LNQQSKSKSKSLTSAPQPLATLFGQSLLLEGEDGATYDQLLAHIRAVVKPADIIDEMFVNDVVSLEWEVLRLRRLKLSFIRVRGLGALQDFFAENLGYDLYSECFADDLAEILQDNLPEDEADSAQTMARQYVDDEPDAIEKVNRVLEGIDLQLGKILRDARARKAKELVQAYVRRDPDAITLINELLADEGRSMDTFMANALMNGLDTIERINRLTTIAESRRNASLHEIERRRAILGEPLRRTVQEIEDGEFKMIETTPANEENAADERLQDQG